MIGSVVRLGKVVGAPKGHDRYRDPRTHQISPALYRVRAPFFWRNTLALVLVSAVPLGVYVYTWNFLTRDDFSDIPIPPIDEEELKQLKKEYEAKKSNASNA